MNWTILIAGFAGGMARGIVGFIKYQYSYKNVPFHLWYFLLIMFLSGVIGLLVAAVFELSPKMSFIIGYAGGDFVENVYKIILKKPSLYELPALALKK